MSKTDGKSIEYSIRNENATASSEKLPTREYGISLVCVMKTLQRVRVKCRAK